MKRTSSVALGFRAAAARLRGKPHNASVSKGKRIRAERKAPPPVRAKGSGGGMPTWAWVAIALGIAAVLGGVLIGASKFGASSDPAPETTASGELAFADEVEAMLDGIPQDGVSLGDPDAPVTLVEFADLQCPFCAQWAREALPVYVEDYVRTGQMRIEFRPLTFIGNESQSAAEIAVAAGEQGKAWNAIDLIYRNQGAENSGWFSSEFIAALGRSIPGLDADQMLSDAAGDGPQQVIDAAATEANEKGIDSTPSFLLGKTGGSLERVQPDSLDADGLREQIEALLNS
jgi:protein-disulfide isomerase